MTAEWPRSLPPRRETWHLQNLSRSGGVSITGQEQVVASGAARWVAALTIPVHRREQVMALRGTIGTLQGRTGTVLIGPQETAFTTWAADEYGDKITPKSVRIPALDGTDYEVDCFTAAASLLQGYLTQDAAIGATAIQFTMTAGAFPEIGNYITVENRMHLLTSRVPLGGSETIIISYAISPPLRFAMTTGHAIEFARPRVEMRLANDDQGGIELQLSRYGEVSLDFVEAF